MLEQLASYGVFEERIPKQTEDETEKQEVKDEVVDKTSYTEEERELFPALAGDEIDDVLYHYYSRPILRRY